MCLFVCLLCSHWGRGGGGGVVWQPGRLRHMRAAASANTLRFRQLLRLLAAHTLLFLDCLSFFFGGMLKNAPQICDTMLILPFPTSLHANDMY